MRLYIGHCIDGEVWTTAVLPPNARCTTSCYMQGWYVAVFLWPWSKPL